MRTYADDVFVSRMTSIEWPSFKALRVSLAREVVRITEPRTKLPVLLSVFNKVQGSVFRLRVQGQVFKAQDSEIRAQCLRFMAEDSGRRARGEWRRAQGSRFRAQDHGSGLRAHGLF